jgi:DHA2 family multidrug resistance protein
MMALTPILGRLYNRVKPALMIAAGVVFFALGTYGLSHITLQSSTSDIVLPMIVTGFGFAALFIPLTTVALTNIARGDLADAAGLNSFVRQVGGSIGLTIFATLLTNYGAEATAAVGAHVSGLRSEAVEQLAGARALFVAHGMDAAGAQAAALRAMAGRVGLQATVLAFERVFLLQGVVFLGVTPLLFFLREKRNDDRHVEMSME